MADDVVAAEVAEQEFARFLDAFDLTEKTQAKSLDADDRKSFESNKETILRAMRRGTLVLDDKSQPVFTPTQGSNTSPITFREPTGATVKAMDQGRKGAEVERSLYLMSAMTGQVRSRFEQMARRDLAVCEALAVLFFA
jgi:uncharacterized protein (UPF0262 family)